MKRNTLPARLLKGEDKPNFGLARRYALDRLERELPAELVYHNFDHTFRVVLPAARWLCDREGVARPEQQLVLTAVLFHDLGYVVRSQEHEQVSAEITSQILPGFGYGPDQVEAIQLLILSTHLPHKPANRLEEIMADADLDVLGRRDFARHNAALRQELEYLGRACTEVEWYTEQLQFMRSHAYFTPSARQRRNGRKAANMGLIARRLATLTMAM